MGFILTAIGLLLLAISLGGIALGLYMAAEPKTRRQANSSPSAGYRGWPRRAAS